MSNNAVLKVSSEQSFWDDKQIAALKQVGLENVPNAELAVFLHYCQRTGLDPFARQIYMIERGNKYTIQASIDGLRIVAQRSGEYAGQVGPYWCGEDGIWTDIWLESTPPIAAKVGVMRKGFTEPLFAVAKFESYAVRYNGKLSNLWAKMPDLMIAKCAEALALRKAFPNDLSGIYTNDEMAQVENTASQPVTAEVIIPAKEIETTVAEPTLVAALQDTQNEIHNVTDMDSLRALRDACAKDLDIEFPLANGTGVTTLRAEFNNRRQVLNA